MVNLVCRLLLEKIFFNDTATTEIYTLSLHDALPILKVKSLSRVLLLAAPWTAACQAPLSMGFSRIEYWSGLPFPSPGSLPEPGIKAGSPVLQEDSLPYEPSWKPLGFQNSPPTQPG